MPTETRTPALPPVVSSAHTPRDERIHALDSLRAVAMFLGILLHGACSFMTAVPFGAWPVRDSRHHGSFEVIFDVVHGFRMHLFFLLAGFFARMLYQRLGPREFAKQRGKRIGWPFLTGLVLVVAPFLIVALWGLSQWDDPGVSALQRPPGAWGPPTAHLWFLQYLLVFYAAAVVVARLTRAVPAAAHVIIDRVFERVMETPLRLFAFVPLTMVFLWRGPFWGDAEFPGASFIPGLRALAHYGLFFFVGWWLHRERRWLDALQRFVPASAFIALLALTLNQLLILRSPPAPSDPNYLALKIASLACAGTYAWAMSFAMMGAFLRLAAAATPWVRYLADASYWCYLMHPALMLYLQFKLAPWSFPAWAKFALLIVATMVPLLLSYHYWVRYTWIGTLLNGPRRPAGERAPAGAA